MVFSESSSGEEDEQQHQDDASTSIIIHLDVDYFYAQCEEIEKPEYRQRPLAVGQKHIIVTCNYVARKMGVKKLQLREQAKRACPSLLILEGSDLERYRRHSRNIYTCFRQAISNLSQQYHVNKVPVRKGGMDEVFCDLTPLVDAVYKTKNSLTLPSNAHVYGNDDEKVVITEDQSGAQSILAHVPSSASSVGNGKTQERLLLAASLAERVRQEIRNTTAFSTSIGVSASPMLAKLASDLRKPNGLSVLYPWRSKDLVLSMPLRKVPQLGRSTLKALEPCLQAIHKNHQGDFWTCRDLLAVPRPQVLACLQTMTMSTDARESLCDSLLEKCQGVDRSHIKDDNGGLSKTVSVENSFRRNTMTSSDAIWHELEKLFERLPRLLQDRSPHSYPTTIRLTAAVLDKSLDKKRPFVTRSKQCSINGKALMATGDASQVLKKAVTPLVNALVLNAAEINVVRLNIAVTGFQDLSPKAANAATSSPWAAFAPKVRNERDKKRQRVAVSSHESRPMSGKCETAPQSSLKNAITGPSKARSPGKTMSSLEAIDPAILSELPADIRAEVCRAYNVKEPSKRTLDHFFSRSSK